MQFHPWVFNRVEQITTANEIKRHIGGLIVLEYLVDAYDVRVVQFRQAACFRTKVLHDRVEFRLMLARARHDTAVVTATHRRRETFLDNDNPIQTVAGEIGHAETASIQELFNPELAVQQLRAGL